jgi:MSHA biogenesis protein MshP
MFILTALSALGAAMIQMLGASDELIAREVISTRALFAAESGVQRKLGEIFPPAAGVAAPAACASAAGLSSTTTYTAANMAGLTGCNSVSVDCRYVVIDAVNYFNLISTGRCGPTNSEAVRVIELQAKSG